MFYIYASVISLLLCLIYIIKPWFVLVPIIYLHIRLPMFLIQLIIKRSKKKELHLKQYGFNFFKWPRIMLHPNASHKTMRNGVPHVRAVALKTTSPTRNDGLELWLKYLQLSSFIFFRHFYVRILNRGSAKRISEKKTLYFPFSNGSLNSLLRLAVMFLLYSMNIQCDSF